VEVVEYGPDLFFRRGGEVPLERSPAPQDPGPFFFSVVVVGEQVDGGQIARALQLQGEGCHGLQFGFCVVYPGDEGDAQGKGYPGMGDGTQVAVDKGLSAPVYCLCRAGFIALRSARNRSVYGITCWTTFSGV